MQISLANIFILIAIIAMVRAAMYGFWFWRTSVLRRDYKTYLDGATNKDKEEKEKVKYWEEYAEKTPEIRELLQRAHVKDWYGTNVEPVGFGAVQTRNYHGFDQLTVLHRDIVQWETEAFHEARGFYRKGIHDSFNPIYWIESLLKLPGSIAVLAGLDEDSRWVKIMNVVVVVPVAIALVYQVATQEPLHLTVRGWFGEIEIQQHTIPQDSEKEPDPSGDEGRKP